MLAHLNFKTQFNNSRLVVSLHTRSVVKANKSALALFVRLDRYFEYPRLEWFQSKELGASRTPLPFCGVRVVMYEKRKYKA